MNLSFQTRIVLFYSILFISVQALTLAATYWVSRENVIAQIGQNLIYADNIFNRQLNAHGDRIAAETRILAADYGFRAAVSAGDADTLASAVENLTYRIHGQRGFYIDPQGKINADTAGKLRGQSFMFPQAVAVADEYGKAVVFGMLDGELWEFAIAPVLAPIPIGWVCIATTVDHGLVNSLKHLSALAPDISILVMEGDTARVLSSSLPQPAALLTETQVFQSAFSETRQPKLITSGARTLVTLIRPLTATGVEHSIAVALQIDLAEAFQPYALLVYGIIGLSILGLAAVLLGGYLLARNIAQPVRELAGATQRMMAGEFKETLPVQRDDELGRLAETFNKAGRIAAEMSELKQRDLMRRELVASVSHDLRTPLTSLHAYLETLRYKAQQFPEAERQRFLESAVRQSEKVGKLAEALFELARLECDAPILQLVDFNIMELLQDVHQKYDLSARQRGINLCAELNPHLPLARADIALIERVLTNLLDNALRHTPAGGEVQLTASVLRGRIHLQVRDSGEGIAAEQLAQLFERDSPLRRRRTVPGGLGLLIAAKIVALHGGEIQAASNPGQGAAFSFDLALAASVQKPTSMPS